MDDRDWQAFFKTKLHPVRIRVHYTMRKVCDDCGRPIVNENQSGYCSRCATKHRYTKKGRIGGESDSHRELKTKAIAFLEALGCSKINLEARVNGARIDVLGITNKRKIGVECGGSHILKLYKLLYTIKVVDELYVWPYGVTSPFRWYDGIEICPHCGHLV